MIIREVEVLVTKTEIKTNGKGEAYVLIDFVDYGSGDSFNIMTKDIEILQKLDKMTKYLINLDLTSSKYGLRLNIDSILKKL